MRKQHSLYKRDLKKVANEIRRMEQLGNDYIAGDRVICKKYLKLKKDKWNANSTYEIMRVDEERVVFKEYQNGGGANNAKHVFEIPCCICLLLYSPF